MADENTGAPAPEAAPPVDAPDSATTLPTESAGETFSGLGQDFDDDIAIDLTAPEAGGQAPAEAKPPQPVTPPPVVPPAPPKPVQAAEPPKAPVVAPPPAPGPKEPQPAAASPPLEPRTLVDQLNQHRADITTELAKTRFAWDPGEQKAFTEALETDAAQALVDWAPKLAARIYYESATMTLNHISQFVPVLLNNYTNLMKQHEAAEKQFFTQFPQLNKAAHWNDIMQFAGLFNKQNPNVSQDDLLAMVGAAVMAKNRIAMAPANGGGPGVPPSRRPSAPPYMPAQAGGSSVRVVTEPESPYAGLGGHYDEE